MSAACVQRDYTGDNGSSELLNEFVNPVGYLASANRIHSFIHSNFSFPSTDISPHFQHFLSGLSTVSEETM